MLDNQINPIVNSNCAVCFGFRDSIAWTQIHAQPCLCIHATANGHHFACRVQIVALFKRFVDGTVPLVCVRVFSFFTAFVTFQIFTSFQLKRTRSKFASVHCYNPLAFSYWKNRQFSLGLPHKMDFQSSGCWFYLKKLSLPTLFCRFCRRIVFWHSFVYGRISAKQRTWKVRFIQCTSVYNT